MIGTVGIKYHAEMGNGGTPMISLAINNEFGDNTIDSTNTYQGGGTAFKTTTAVEELSATLGSRLLIMALMQHLLNLLMKQM